MKPGAARSKTWMFALALMIGLPACTTPRIPASVWQCESFVRIEPYDDGTWLLCIEPNDCLEAGSTVGLKNINDNVWVGGYVQDDGSFCFEPFRGAPGELIQLTISSPSGEVITVCYDLTAGEPVEDPYCGEPPS